MKKVLPFLVAALLIPGAALAKGPQKGTHANQSSKAKVMYVLKGLLYNYQAYDAQTQTDGSIQIVVLHSNRHGKLLRSDPNNNPLYVTIALGPKTKVRFKHGVTFNAGDRGTVKIRASRFAFKGANAAADPTAIENAFSGQYAYMVRDWGPPKSS